MKRFCLCVLMAVSLFACNKAPNAGYAADSVPAAEAQMADVSQARMAGGADKNLTALDAGDAQTDPALKKYIALRHQLTIESSAKNMQASFDAAVQHCVVLNCQVLSANYNKKTPYSPPSANLSVRVPPKNVDTFFGGLEKNGEITQHGRDSEDKTNQVVDADARIKNLTDFRDQLRVMQNDKSAKFKDLIEVQSKLVEIQSELDSIMSMRKILSQETDMVAVNIQFIAAQGITEQGFFAPVLRAFKDSGRVLMESFGMVITFLVGAIPWLLIGVPVILLLRKFWQKIKAKLFK